MYWHSGSSSGSNSIPHSFSVDEIQKMRVKLKASKSFPNDLPRQPSDQQNDESTDNQQYQTTQVQKPLKLVSQKDKLSVISHDECDNSSSGVSSDQEVSNPKSIINKSCKNVSNAKTTLSNNTLIANPENNNCPKEPQTIVGILKTNTANAHSAATTQIPNTKILTTVNKKSVNLPIMSNTVKKTSVTIAEDAKNANNYKDLDGNVLHSPPSPPSNGFQRHNSLTRKQAATIAMNRGMHAKSAISLAQLPPPIEGDSDDPDCPSNAKYDINNVKKHDLMPCIKGSKNTIIRNASQITRNSQQVSCQMGHHVRTSNTSKSHNMAPISSEEIVLAPPPQFCDSNFGENPKSNSVSASIQLLQQKKETAISTNNESTASRTVRIVGALRKN